MDVEVVKQGNLEGFEYKVKHFRYPQEEEDFIRDYSMGLNTHWYCGYVKVPESHEYHGKFYDDIPIDCHGGLTYGQEEEDGYWIGFDCNHAWDTPENQDMAYAEKECFKIINQLISKEK